MQFGSGDFIYHVDLGWKKFPCKWEWGWVSGVACDSQDRVYIYSRSEYPLTIFDRNGEFLTAWGQGILENAHGIFIDLADNVWLTDHTTHCVYKFDQTGKCILVVGLHGKAADKPGEPFRAPTNVAIASSGEIIVSDGYENFRIHKFSPEGKHLTSWGEKGTGPGQFALPHNVRIDKNDRVWVCDRENYRIQIFDLDGHYLTEWKDIKYPGAIYFDPRVDVVYVAEMDRQVSIYTLNGELIAQWGGLVESNAPGEFLAFPHDIWMDSQGDLYVTEVGENARIWKYLRQ
jgi:streptogramin lyase